MSKFLIIAIILLIIAGGLYLEHRRGGNLAAVADKLGLSFQGDRKHLPEEVERAGFDLFTQGGNAISNWMEGENQGIRVAIFDYGYEARVAGEGERGVPVSDDQQGRENRLQSVIWVHSGLKLPDFDLSPSGIHQRTVAARFGLSRLTFDGDTPFNRRYILLARDAERVRRLFTPAVRRQLLAQSGLVFESRGRDALFYHFQERVEAKRIPGFLKQAEGLLQLMSTPE